MKKYYVFLFLLGWVVLEGCATQSEFSKTFPRRLTETQASWHAHNRLVNAGAPKVQTTGTAISIEQSLQHVLDQLVYVSPLRGHTIRVLIANDQKVNAHTDGRAIYLNAGLLKAFQGNDQLVASVLAHELGHILAGHTSRSGSRSGLTYLSYLTPALGALPYGGLYGGLAGTALREGDKMREYAYSKHQENEADAIGAFIAIDAGYDAIGLSEFLEHTGKSGFAAPRSVVIPTSLSGIPQTAAVALLSSSPLYSTHPPSKSRKKIIDGVIRRKKGMMTQDDLRNHSRWLAELYQTLELCKPKNK